jgi:hypothetical protein
MVRDISVALAIADNLIDSSGVADSFLIGCGAGFSGDRIDAPQSVVATMAASGRPGAIMFETLAERTLALGHVRRRLDPSAGYEPLLAQFIAPVLRACIEHGIAIVGNFGAANPPEAARLIRQLAAEQGLGSTRVAVVQGDDIRETVDLSSAEIWEGDVRFEQGESEIIAANVYLGAKPIADALRQGAQVVVTGRVADPSLALGPLVAHYGWDWEDWDRIAAGTLVGHLLECGAQVTGGYFADPGYKDVPSPATIGFPIAEVAANGSAVITKATGTGGLVTVQTVTEQLLYEVHDPAAYLTPDVILDITGVRLSQIGPDRVSVGGARGHGRPPSLKATVSFAGDWLGEGEISYAGPNAQSRARLAAEVLKERIALRGLPVRCRLDLIGAACVFDSDNAALAQNADPLAPEMRTRLAVSAPDREPVEAALQEVLALLCCGPAGGGGWRQNVQNRIRTVSYLVPRHAVSPAVTFADEA